MRRPSGFDREPEPRRRPEPEPDPASELVDEFVAPTIEESSTAKRAGRFSWPRRKQAVPEQDLVPEQDSLPEQDVAREGAAGAAEFGATGVSGAAEAATVDLSGVADDLAEVTEITALPTVEDAVVQVVPEPREDPLRAAEQQLKAAIRGRKQRERREQRRFTWHVRKRRRPWLIAGAAVLAVALFVVVGVFTPLMSVREIRVEGAERVDAAAVQEALAPLSGRPLALVNQSEVHQALVPFPLIQRYSVETIPPHTLVVRVEERVPVLALPSDAGVDVVDPAGVTLEQHEARPEGIPLAEGPAADRTSKGFQAVALVLRDMPPELRAQFVAATASTGQDVKLTLQSGIEVVWGEPTETPRKAVVLAAMLQALGDRPVSLIDVSSSEAPIFH